VAASGRCRHACRCGTAEWLPPAGADMRADAGRPSGCLRPVPTCVQMRDARVAASGRCRRACRCGTPEWLPPAGADMRAGAGRPDAPPVGSGAEGDDPCRRPPPGRQDALGLLAHPGEHPTLCPRGRPGRHPLHPPHPQRPRDPLPGASGRVTRHLEHPKLLAPRRPGPSPPRDPLAPRDPSPGASEPVCPVIPRDPLRGASEPVCPVSPRDPPRGVSGRPRHTLGRRRAHHASRDAECAAPARTAAPVSPRPSARDRQPA
jgi:hypothetical protein